MTATDNPRRKADDRRPIRVSLAFLFFYGVSGAAGLVYEVTWTRLLTLQLGHTVAAASTVLAAFMGGLAAGAWIAGTWPTRSVGESTRTGSDPARSLRLYAALEIFIAVAALLLPVLLRASVPALAWAYADGEAPARFAFVRVAISFVLVGIPAAAMGATFPIVGGALARAAVETGALYAANTAGAAAGAIAAGFWLIPAVGLRGATWVGVALNVVAAAGAFWVANTLAGRPGPLRLRSHEDRASSGETRRSAEGAKAAAPPSLALLAAVVSGFSALIYEVAWTRLLALVIGPTTYAFATMAASFISGLALGSAAGTRLARRTASPATWLGAVLLAGAAAATITAWYAATNLPLTVAAQVADPAVEFPAVRWRQAALVALLLLPMTFALGATFPLALAVAGGSETNVTRDSALVYTANTVGAIAGALAAGFLLIPTFGLRDTIRIAALCTAMAASICFLLVRSAGPERDTTKRQTHDGSRRASQPGPKDPAYTRRRRLAFGVAATIAVAITIVMSPPWDRALLASGAYKYAPYLGPNDLDAVLRAGTLEYYTEGSSGTVTVRDLTGTRSLAIDGKVDASNGGDMLTQRLLGLLPVLVHGNAQDVAIIGLGSGVTAGSALAAGTVRRADVIEISPEVVEASRFFDRESGQPLSQPGVRLIVGDGRSHLLLTPRQYDVIVSEPSNPWMAGVAALFTREFFEAARSRLRPSGLLCQWAHTYDIRPDDLRSIVRTFASVFPESTMWLVGGGDLLLIGARDGSLAARLASVGPGTRGGSAAAVLGDVGIAPGAAPFALLSVYAGGPREIARFGGDEQIQTDDRTSLEYSAPRGIYGRTREDNAAAIVALDAERPPAVADAFKRATADDWASRGAMNLKAQAFATAYDAFRQAVTLNSRHAAALAGLSDAAGGSTHLPEERAWLEEIARREPANVEVRIELSRVLAVTGDGPAAVRTASDALRLAPDNPLAAEQLASVLADTGDGQRLVALSEEMVQRFPGRIDGLYYRATALLMAGRTEEAITLARRIVDTNPSHARAQNLLGTACAAANRRDCAKAGFEASVRTNPRDPSGYVNAGLFHLQAADPAGAMSYFASALAIDPSQAAARQGLAQARSLLASR